MKARLVTGVGALVLGLAWGCASGPNPTVEAVRGEFRNVSAEPEVNKYAPLQLDDARKSVMRLEHAAENDADDSEIDHLAYLSRARMDIARANAADAVAQEKVKQLGQERERLMVAARSGPSAADQAELERARARAAQLQSENAQLQARETPEGIVLRMGDVFFATGKDELLPGSQDLVGRVAKYLNEFPDRKIEVIGHTDSQGSAASNRRLSEQRAESVAAHLRQNGVAGDRIRTVGYGSSKPVAPNSNAAGRQQNRRVEIVLENPRPVAKPPVEQPGGD